MSDEDARPTHLGGPLVAISATYGAGGPQVGQRVAERLGVPFLDHNLSSQALEQSRAADSGEVTTWGGLLRNRTRGDSAQDDIVLRRMLSDLEDRAAFAGSDAEVLDLVTSGGVVAGRASPHLLREIPGVLRVFLDGPREARIEQGAEFEGVDGATAARRQQAHDASRMAVVRARSGSPREAPFTPGSTSSVRRWWPHLGDDRGVLFLRDPCRRGMEW